MQDQDREEFAMMMGEMAISFRTEIDRETLETYFKKLIGLTLFQVGLSINKITLMDEYFPKLSRVSTLAATFKREPGLPVRDSLQIEEQTFHNDMPRTKEAFFEAMDKLYGKVEAK